ncbi:MAG TPA: LPS assembly protein LptD [Candidatus Acidoferrales bacterium]|nr:LPS assembly protein LptD [Candidatus Acidoferrales bacterium]
MRRLLHFRLPSLLLLLACATCPAGAQVRLPAGRGIVELQAKEQGRKGSLWFADGDVDVRYENLRLRADHVEYDTATGDAAVRGHVRFDLDNQHIEAGEGRYNIRTRRGSFKNVRGSIFIRRRPNPGILISPNPFSFEAREVERVDDRTYEIHSAWVTVCDPDKSVWRFYTRRATIKLERQARLQGAGFSLLGVPVIYLPYATVPMARRPRQSGFLLPQMGTSSRKGFTIGEAFYWAPAEWMDMTLGAEYLSRRGVAQNVELRARPWENMRLHASYFAVNDRGLRGPGGARVPQAGHQSNVSFDAFLPGGWRAVLDANQLTSLKFRLAFAETFAEAVNSEVRSSAFVTNNFRGFSLNFSASNYKNFLSATPETAVVLRAAPGVRLSSVEQAPWERWPIYFGFHASADAVYRSQPSFTTPSAVQRFEFAPRVTIPLRWGPWLGVMPTFLVRSTQYGAQLSSGTVIGQSLRRTTGEVNVDVRPPALARVWENGDSKWRHVVEPLVVYRYVRGVNAFGRFLRFDETDTLTDTNELEYGITQRFFRREAAGGGDEVVSWRVAQKYYFDPTFNGAIVPGQRNVFQALNSITPYAFADAPRRFSPVVSDVRITPGGRYDAQLRMDIDPLRSKITAVGTLVRVRPYREAFITLAHFATDASPALQPRSNQIRALVGYGELNRIGWNGSFGFSYDVNQGFLQNQIVQVSYNGHCCGIGFEYRRLALGPVRSENQFRVALLIANLGTFGSLRRQEKIFE